MDQVQDAIERFMNLVWNMSPLQHWLLMVAACFGIVWLVGRSMRP
jgi:hypothetical protein